jgi:hypothetical protein
MIIYSESLYFQVKAMIDLDNKEILQINNAIIACALVFLTLSSIAATSEERWYKVSSIAFSVGIIIIFSVSSLKTINGHRNWAREIMKFGFYCLIPGGVAYGVSNYEGYLKSLL